MKQVICDDPAQFASDMLAGFAAANKHVVKAVHGGVVRRPRPSPGKVAVVIGGGSGHYPAFCGTVGPGFANGAVVGNVFTSPSAEQAYSVAKQAQVGGGVVFSYGNYAGDVMNFGLAQDHLIADGIPTRTVLVTDDIASAPPEEKAKRRGIAGDFAVFKALSAAAEEGLPLEAVVEAGLRANAATRSFGVAFAGCTLPGATSPLFSVPDGRMGIGLGIHGEPGVAEADTLDAKQLAQMLVGKVLAEEPAGSSKRLAVILNGLGNTKYEELFAIYKTVDQLLVDAGYEIVEPEVGELVTSLDMAGCSLTIMWLDADLERWWRAPALSAAYVKGAIQSDTDEDETADVNQDQPVEAYQTGQAGPVGQAQARAVARVLIALEAMLLANADELGRIDAVAGDGDHGRGMVKGCQAARAAAAQVANTQGDGTAGLRAAGQAWADQAGGTSGVLWGAGLMAFATALPVESPVSAADLAKGCAAFMMAVQELGKARLGDKTMLDTLAPFVEELNQLVADDPGLSPGKAWVQAGAVAKPAAAATAALVPKVGRARPLADRSIGTPDAGATSMALIIECVGATISEEC